VYVVDEAGPLEKFGFAYSTLPGHAERCEERFQAEWDTAGGGVVRHPGVLPPEPGVNHARPAGRPHLAEAFGRALEVAMLAAVRPAGRA
jgi:hypothetical protein